MKFKRVLAVGDIHGCFRLLEYLIEKSIVFNPESDKLVFLGDYIDRGSENRKVVEYVKELRRRHPENVVLLKGNHEDMALLVLEGASGARPGWMSNGGDATNREYPGESDRRDLAGFIRSLSLFHETDTHVFAHASVPAAELSPVAHHDEILWAGSFANPTAKCVVVGHTIHSRVAFYPNNVVCVDTGGYANGVLSAYDVIGGKVYQATKGDVAEPGGGRRVR